MGIALPSARSLYLCESYRSYTVDRKGRVDLFGIFNSIQVAAGSTRLTPKFCVFAQLVNGLGSVPFFIDVRRAEDDAIIWTTNRRELVFPNRSVVVHMAVTIEGCRFERPGVYLLELFCDNTWIADTRLMVSLE
jgi:hypothetical protein